MIYVERSNVWEITKNKSNVWKNGGTSTFLNLVQGKNIGLKM